MTAALSCLPSFAKMALGAREYLILVFSKLQENVGPAIKNAPKYLVSVTHVIVDSGVLSRQQFNFQPLLILRATYLSTFNLESNSASSSQKIFFFNYSVNEGANKTTSSAQLRDRTLYTQSYSV